MPQNCIPEPQRGASSQFSSGPKGVYFAIVRRPPMRLSRRRELLLAGIFVMGCVNQGRAALVLYGSSDLEDLFTIDLATGHGTRVGSLPASATEIEFEDLTGRAYL